MVGSCRAFSLLCISSAHPWQCDTNAAAAMSITRPNPAPGVIIADSACRCLDTRDTSCFKRAVTTPSIASSFRTFSLLCVSPGPTRQWSLMQRVYNYLTNVLSSSFVSFSLYRCHLLVL
ncbi:hypothetical protein C8R48DRAFT_742136 [Suillus tomentosus]|nr:hypothetical protein C8R48DRAFT_742136 [Suillus tomentosus]